MLLDWVDHFRFSNCPVWTTAVPEQTFLGSLGWCIWNDFTSKRLGSNMSAGNRRWIHYKCIFVTWSVKTPWAFFKNHFIFQYLCWRSTKQSCLADSSGYVKCGLTRSEDHSLWDMTSEAQDPREISQICPGGSGTVPWKILLAACLYIHTLLDVYFRNNILPRVAKCATQNPRPPHPQFPCSWGWYFMP